MRRVVLLALVVVAVVLAWSAIARAQDGNDGTYRVYLPHLRKDATPIPTATPTPVPTPTRGVECGTVFYSGFEEDGVWQIDNVDFAKIVTEKPFAGKRSMRLAPKKNADVTVNSPGFPWAGDGTILSAKLTAAWRGDSDDDKAGNDDLYLSAAKTVGDWFSPVLAHLENQSAGGSWNLATKEFHEGDFGLFPEIRTALFRAIAYENESERTTWWIDEVRVETCVKPAP